MIRIIINADDMGLTPIVNNEIERALKNDWITSATIMANTQYMEDVLGVVNSYPNKSFGVHLNVTEGPSLTKSPVLREVGMIDGSGCFVKGHTFKTRIYDQRVQHAIEEEWSAQVYEVLSRGINVSHVDGHHHCHTWYGFAKPLVAVMKKYGICKVRNTFNTPFVSAKERLVDNISGFLFNCGMLNIADEEKAKRLRPSIRSCMDKRVFWSYLKDVTKANYFDAYKTVCTHAYGRLLSSLFHDGVVIELMCHPGHPLYEEEFELLKNDSLSLQKDYNVATISYNDL